jgi:hypothetical protein
VLALVGNDSSGEGCRRYTREPTDRIAVRLGHTEAVNKTPLWERVMSGFAGQRSEFPDFDWNAESLVHRDRRCRHIAEAETLFAVTNGFIGVRGAFEEDEPAHERATLINGFHETWPIVYGEAAYGFARNGQTIVPVPDPTTMKLYIDDEPFAPSTGGRES